MNKRLFFICPTDFLEKIINDTFKGENYFVTSLGNSVVLDAEKVNEINALIEAKGIKEITFVLSDDNRIVHDAFAKQKFSKIIGLSNFYSEITNRNMHSLWSWQIRNLNNAVISNHLNKKISALRPKLSGWLMDKIELNTKIFYRQRSVFNEIHNDLLQIEISMN